MTGSQLLITAAQDTNGQQAWLEFIIAGATGGLAVKLLDVLYQEIRRRIEKKTTVEDFVQAQLDPILKAADELVGKLYSLAQEDFGSMPEALNRQDKQSYENVDLTSILYLFSQFWATIEILRRASIYVRLADSPSGTKLTKFLECIESRRVRVLVRVRQRAIGESLIVADRERIRAMGFSEFTATLSTDDTLLEWTHPLAEILIRTKHGSRTQQTTERQRLLQYGIILQALIDDLDPDHATSRERSPLTTKLSRQTRPALSSRVFALYLPFVEDSEKYWQHPRKRNGARGHG